MVYQVVIIFLWGLLYEKQTCLILCNKINNPSENVTPYEGYLFLPFTSLTGLAVEFWRIDFTELYMV